jgi:hypothetical protein
VGDYAGDGAHLDVPQAIEEGRGVVPWFRVLAFPVIHDDLKPGFSGCLYRVGGNGSRGTVGEDPEWMSCSQFLEQTLEMPGHGIHSTTVRTQQHVHSAVDVVIGDFSMDGMHLACGLEIERIQ